MSVNSEGTDGARTRHRKAGTSSAAMAPATVTSDAKQLPRSSGCNKSISAQQAAGLRRESGGDVFVIS